MRDCGFSSRLESWNSALLAKREEKNPHFFLESQPSLAEYMIRWTSMNHPTCVPQTVSQGFGNRMTKILISRAFLSHLDTIISEKTWGLIMIWR
jgi:hypothetical protein